MTYDHWKTTEPDREPSPGEHQPYNLTCDCDDCAKERSVTLTYDQLLARVIDDGIAEVKEAYVKPEDHHKRDGAIEGFEACRGKTPDQIVALWTEAEQGALKTAYDLRVDTGDGLREYWRQRYKALQIEWVLNVSSVALGQSLLGHLPTARGAQCYARILAKHMGVLP